MNINDNNIEVVNIPLDDILDAGNGRIELGAGQWINFINVPSGAVINISFNSNANGAKIPVKQGLQVLVPHNEVYLWSDTALAGESLTVAHGSGDFVFKNPPISDFDSLGTLGAVALAQFDKIANPYDTPAITLGQSESTTLIVSLNKNLTCDKIRVILSGVKGVPATQVEQYIYIDSNIVASNVSYFVSGNHRTQSIVAEFDGVNGKNLQILSRGTTGAPVGYSLEEYTLKP